MKIARISVYHVDLPLEHPYWLSGGRLKVEALDATPIACDGIAEAFGIKLNHVGRLTKAAPMRDVALDTTVAAFA